MKWLILVSLVAFAKGDASDDCAAKCTGPYYEPGEYLPYKCRIGPGTGVYTYDRADLKIVSGQKTLLSKWDVDELESCKFQVRGVTSDECGSNNDVDLFLDWIGFGMHVDNNPNQRNYRNWVLGQSFHHILERGHISSRGETCRTIPWCFPFESAEETYSWLRPPKCNPLYCILLDPYTYTMQIRSPCCQLAIDWFPADEATIFEIHLGEFYAKETEGICGNANWNPLDDWMTCDGEPCPESNPACVETISNSCADGDHTGQGFRGCNRMKPACGP